MLGVVIVDDDGLIREGLKTSVEWEEYGFEVIGEAENGQIALQVIEEMRPVLIISDIRMPKKNGLELLSDIYELNLAVKVVMISAFNDFEYVREAMKLGARNYILKPLNQDEIVSTLKILSDEFEDEIRDSGARKEGFIALRNDVLSRMLRGEITSRELSEKLEILDINLDGYAASVGLFKASVELRYLTISLDELENYIYMCLDQSHNIIVFQGKGEYINIIFLDKEDKINQEHIKDSLKLLIKKINIRYHLDCNLSVGCRVQTYKKIALSYEEALRGQDCRIIYGTNRVIFYEDVKKIKEKEVTNFYIPTKEIKDLILSQNIKDTKVVIDEFFNKVLGNPKRSPDEIIFATLEILSEVYSILRGMKINLNNYKSESLVKIIMEMDNLKKLENWLMDQIIDAVNKISDYRKHEYSDMIYKTVNNICDHYSDSRLSLKTLSYEMNVSATHLGRMFKNETGEYFSDYLNKIRIDFAKEFLLTTDMSSKEIGKKVGIENVNYFYTVFKKQTGVSTSAYKKNMSVEK